MTRRALVCLSLLAFAACQGDRTLAPSTPADKPSLVISDGAHTGVGNDPGANPDFFFLPLMVPSPRFNPNWTVGGFNRFLSPKVVICPLDLPASAPASAVLISTPCKSTGVVTLFGPSQVKLHTPPTLDPDDDVSAFSDDWAHYHAKWQIPNSASQKFYRIKVLVGNATLGFADVHSTRSLFELLTVNYNKFVGRPDGWTLHIPFRIENGALCLPAGHSPCSTSTIDPATGGTVFYTEGDETVGGVTIPPQPGGGDPIAVSIQRCASGNLPIDLPLFGSCLTVLTNPARDDSNPLIVPGSVFVCDLEAATGNLTHRQEELVSLHRKHGSQVDALPHVPDSCPTVISEGSFGGLIRAVAQGRWRAAGRELFGLVAPAPLYARRLDVGPAGETFAFSDFQFALPAKMEILSGNQQSAPAGTALANPLVVLVTDLDGNGVENARVHFATTDGSLTPTTVLSASNGQAQSSWTLSATPGSNFATASGVGIATLVSCPEGPCTPTDGPRSIFDPFMSIQTQAGFNPAGDPVPNPLTSTPLQTGTLNFFAFGCTGSCTVTEGPSLMAPAPTPQRARPGRGVQ
jgi:hypothetical protein